MSMNANTMSRRSFLASATASTAALALSVTALADEGKTAAEDYAEEIDADVVIVGAGVSGLAAAMQAADLGLNAIVLEKNDVAGGNSNVTSGIFCYNSARQKELGIELDLGAMMQEEQQLYNYTNDSLLFRDLALASADNIDWLESHGVPFSDVIDDFNGYGHLSCFQWWGDKTGATYLDAVLAELDKLGVEIRTSTPVHHLVQDESGTVTGVVAEDADGLILVRAKAVALACGGWLQNEEKMSWLGYEPEVCTIFSNPGHDGDGVRMAIEAGADDLTLRSTYVEEPHLSDLDWPLPTNDLTDHGLTLWVNQAGERFVDEWCMKDVLGLGANAIHSQAKAFTIFDQALAEQVGTDAVDEIMSHNAYGDKAKADTVEDLAEALGLDPEVFAQTVSRYNELCEQGEDVDFKKDSSKLNPLSKPPFYGCRLTSDMLTSIGGIPITRNFEVTTLRRKKIAGLYAIGVDGCQIYRDTYAFNLPGTADANNIHSARVAMKHIAVSL